MRHATTTKRSRRVTLVHTSYNDNGLTFMLSCVLSKHGRVRFFERTHIDGATCPVMEPGQRRQSPGAPSKRATIHGHRSPFALLCARKQHPCLQPMPMQKHRCSNSTQGSFDRGGDAFGKRWSRSAKCTKRHLISQGPSVRSVVTKKPDNTHFKNGAPGGLFFFHRRYCASPCGPSIGLVSRDAIC